MRQSFQSNLYDSKSNCSSFVAQGSRTQHKHGFVVLLCIVDLEVCCQTVGSTPGRFFTNILVIGGPWGRERAAEGRMCVGWAQARKKQGACCDGSQCFMPLRLSLRDQKLHGSQVLKNRDWGMGMMKGGGVHSTEADSDIQVSKKHFPILSCASSSVLLLLLLCSLSLGQPTVGCEKRRGVSHSFSFESIVSWCF